MSRVKLNFKKTGGRVLLIIFLSSLVGIGVNISLVVKYAKGNYKKGFLHPQETSSITFISLPQAEEYFFSHQALFIDSRSREEFRKGHIPNALNLPYEEADSTLLQSRSLSQEKILVVYCDGEECQSSVHLGRKLSQMGYSQIKVFFGGWKEWKEAGLPVEGSK